MCKTLFYMKPIQKVFLRVINCENIMSSFFNNGKVNSYAYNVDKGIPAPIVQNNYGNVNVNPRAHRM